MSNEWLVEKLQNQIDILQEKVYQIDSKKSDAYLERNRVVAFLASFLDGVRCKTAIDGWSESWHNCVYIQFSDNGKLYQWSWHYHDSHAHLFEHLPEQKVEWNGHTTEMKYEQMFELSKRIRYGS